MSICLCILITAERPSFAWSNARTPTWFSLFFFFFLIHILLIWWEILLEEFSCILSKQVLAFWCRLLYSFFFLESAVEHPFFLSFHEGCATTVLVTCAGMGEMLLQLLVGSVRKPCCVLIVRNFDCLTFIWSFALFLFQVINTHGNYSFILCGMIFGCMGFTFFLALLLVQHRHKKYLAGTIAF